MELEHIMLSEISQSEKDKYISFHSYEEYKEKTKKKRDKQKTDPF